MFYLANTITKPWCIVPAGEEIEIISARTKSAIIIKTKSGERLTVDQSDITDVKPLVLPKVQDTMVPASKATTSKGGKSISKQLVTETTPKLF